MTLLKDFATPHLLLAKQAAKPDAPGTGDVKVYALTDGTLAYLDDADDEHVLVTGTSGVFDADDITYTPFANTDWDSDADPGDVNDALDQLAERVDDLEGAGYLTAVDAGDVTYTPTTATDWDSDADPGDLDDALDQLAERVDDLEGAGYIASVTDMKIFTREGEVEATAGTMRIWNHTGATLTITAVHADVDTAPTGAALIVDVHLDGTTIFTDQGDRPTIADAANSSGAETPAVTAWADGEYLTCDCDQIGSTTPGEDLTVTVVYTH